MLTAAYFHPPDPEMAIKVYFSPIDNLLFQYLVLYASSCLDVER